MSKAIVVFVLLPFLSFAQTLQIESGVTLTSSKVSSPQPGSSYKQKVVLPGFYAQVLVELVVNEYCQLQTGIRRVQYKVGVEYGSEQGTMIYRQSFWQVPVLLNVDIPLSKKLQFNVLGGVNSFRPGNKDVYSTQYMAFNDPRTYYHGEKYEFGWEAGL